MSSAVLAAGFSVSRSTPLGNLLGNFAAHAAGNLLDALLDILAVLAILGRPSP